jgi:DNA-binding response OmpR family regulator
MNQETLILVVDDHSAVLENLAMTLETAGYRVRTARDGTQALQLLECEPVHLILADISMPGMNGYQLLERVRQNPRWLLIPFVFLTARILDSDVRYGKELGADDYLTKPIQPEDLLASVQGKLRRARQLEQFIRQPEPPPALETRVQVCGPLRVDPAQHRVWMHEQPVELSAREFIVLSHLAHRHGYVVSLQELIQLTHNLETDHIEAGTLLRPVIRSLRRKLGYPVGEMGCIETVRGVGYRLVAPQDT